MVASFHGQSWAGFAALGLWMSTTTALFGCQAPARVVQTVLDPYPVDAHVDLPAQTPLDSGQDESPIKQAPAADSCPAGLDQRLSVTSIQLNRDVRYKQLGYGRFPLDERIAFAAARDGGGYVAWTDDASGRVFVTPLNERYERAGPDIDPNGYDVGGIVAHDDGFALLTLRNDPAGSGSMPSPDSNIGRAVTLVRFRNGLEAYSAPLTGGDSVTQLYDPVHRDSAPGYLYGRLAWNGAKYGAYFIVQIAPKDAASSFVMTDKLVYVDDSGGGLRGGFTGKCSSNQGLRLWPEPDVFTPVCLTDGAPMPGLNLVLEDEEPQLLAREASAPDWSAGQMGSIVKLPDDNTYFVGWLSRDVIAGGPDNQTARWTTDIALLRLGPDHKPIGQKRWLVETESAAETNLHFARYGSSQILMAWDAIVDVRCDRMCFGSYGGTYASVLDREGNVIDGGPLRAVPNHHDDLVTLPNGDVAWAYVPDAARDYSSVPQSRDDRVPGSAKRKINIARLRYCESPTP